MVIISTPVIDVMLRSQFGYLREQSIYVEFHESDIIWDLRFLRWNWNRGNTFTTKSTSSQKYKKVACGSSGSILPFCRQTGNVYRNIDINTCIHTEISIYNLIGKDPVLFETIDHMS